MAVNWEDFLPEVMLDVMGCPDSIAENAVKQSAIEFCNQSRVYRDQLADLSTANGTPTYSIVVPAGSEMIALHKVNQVGQQLPLPTIPTILLDRFIISTTPERPRWFNQETPATITFFHTPDDIYTYNLFAILKPTKASTSGPDFLFNDWLEPIAHGAKKRLKAMSGRTWFDGSMVKYHSREFINGWVEARIRDAKSNVMSSSVVRPQKFGFYRSSRRI